MSGPAVSCNSVEIKTVCSPHPWIKAMSQIKTTIFIVEDDRAIRKGLMDVLVFNGYKVEASADGGEGLSRILENRYDLVLLDVMLPTMDGFTICREIRKASPHQPVIMLTAKGAEEDIVNGFQAGADDYIAKPFSLRELMVRIEAVLRRSGKGPSQASLRCGQIIFDDANLRVSHAGDCIDLTRKEMDIIIYLHRFQDRIVSKKELLTEVWHYSDTSIETRTIDIHMQKLRKKLTSVGAPENMIRTIRGEGYRLEYEKA
jgi:DNA-binding response OmpR family regulator